MKAWAEVGSTLGNDPVKESFGPWRGQVVHGTAAPGTLSSQGHLVGVAAEASDVSLNGLQRLQLVKQSLVARCLGDAKGQESQRV